VSHRSTRSLEHAGATLSNAARRICLRASGTPPRRALENAGVTGALDGNRCTNRGNAVSVNLAGLRASLALDAPERTARLLITRRNLFRGSFVLADPSSGSRIRVCGRRGGVVGIVLFARATPHGHLRDPLGLFLNGT
jgi:hypothetical protein